MSERMPLPSQMKKSLSRRRRARRSSNDRCVNKENRLLHLSVHYVCTLLICEIHRTDTLHFSFTSCVDVIIPDVGAGMAASVVCQTKHHTFGVVVSQTALFAVGNTPFGDKED